MAFILYICVGILAGFIAGKIMRGGGFGMLINLLLGMCGGFLGGWVFSLFGLSTTNIIGNLITSVIGAVIILWIGAKLSKPKK